MDWDSFKQWLLLCLNARFLSNSCASCQNGLLSAWHWLLAIAVDLGDCPLLQSPVASLKWGFVDPKSTLIDDGETSTLWRHRRLALSALVTTAEACWVSMWRRRSTLRWNALEQTRHANGLNPVCLRLWVMRFDDWLKALPHWRQT